MDTRSPPARDEPGRHVEDGLPAMGRFKKISWIILMIVLGYFYAVADSILPAPFDVGNITLARHSQASR